MVYAHFLTRLMLQALLLAGPDDNSLSMKYILKMARIDKSIFLLKDGRVVTLRNIISSDAEDFLMFREQIATESNNTMQYVGMTLPTVEEAAKRLQAQFDDTTILNIGVFDGQKLVGYLNFRAPYPDHPWAKHIGQFGMMILKEYWGHGLGKRLLELQEAHAKSHGITRIEAMVRTKNHRGISLYEHNGYKIEGTRRRAAKIDGELHDEYFIAKILD